MKEILQTKFSTDYMKNIEILLARCSNREKVEFALYCASDLEQYYDVERFPKIYRERRECIELVKAWLVDPSSVNIEQLRIAANAATAATATATAAAAYSATAAASAAIAVATTASATAARAATTAAASTASAAAYYSATAAARAAIYAADAASDNHSAKLKHLYNWLFDKMTKDLNKNTLEVLYE